MRIKFIKPKQQEEQSDDVLRLSCEIGAYGRLDLFACDKNGEALDQGYILAITEEGKLQLHTDVSTPGIQTDGNGFILIE